MLMTARLRGYPRTHRDIVSSSRSTPTR